MVAHGSHRVELDVVPLSRDPKAIGYRLVGLRIGPQQKLALRAATRVHVTSPSNDFSCGFHALYVDGRECVLRLLGKTPHKIVGARGTAAVPLRRPILLRGRGARVVQGVVSDSHCW